MSDLLHYMRRPHMPLPTDMIEAIGGTVTARTTWTWTTLTDAERDAMWAIYPPVVAIATFSTLHFDFAAVAETEQAARRALELAWRTHAEEHRDWGADPSYPVAGEANVLTGQIGTVWRDGTYYPKGDN